jgi:protein transport protein SEC24
MRCSLNVIPQTKDLLNKSRLPFGVLIHPFKDLEVKLLNNNRILSSFFKSLSVIQGTKIIRCDGCKSYINPFVIFLDNTQWRCSICFRVNACKILFSKFLPHSLLSSNSTTRISI